MGNGLKPLLLATPDSEHLASEVQQLLGGRADYGSIRVEPFACGEWDVEVPHVRGRHVYVFHTPVIRGEYNPDGFYAQAALIDDAIRRSIQPGGSIIYVTPHLPYQRQERQDKPRKPISSRRMMNNFHDRDNPVSTNMVTFDMHSDAIMGQVPYPIEHLHASPLLLERFRGKDVVFVAPDAGAAKATRKVAQLHASGTEIVLIDKRRPKANEAAVMNVVGAELVQGRVCIMFDDMCDTGGTLAGGAEALRRHGATDVYACFTHAVLSPSKGSSAEDKLRKAGIKAVTTNSIWRGEKHAEENRDWLDVVSLGPTIAKAIPIIEEGGSLSEISG